MTETPMSLRLATTILAIIFLGASVAVFFSHGSVSRTVGHNRKIQDSFDLVHEFIRGWQADHGRLPSESEFGSWKSRFPQKAFGPRHVIFSRSSEESLADEVLYDFGPPGPGESYLLSFWHDDWMDYSPSWTEETNLVLDEADFYFFGSHARDSAFWGLLAVAVATSSRLVSPSRRLTF